MKRKNAILSLVLVAALLLSMTAVPLHTSAEEAVALQDAGFEGSIWSDGIWSYWIDGSDWDSKKIENFLYSSDTWMTPATDGGNQCIKFYMSADGVAYFTQVLENVPAGTYTLSVQSMGGDGETVAVIMGEMVGDTVQTDAGYNNWTTSSGTFTLTEDCAELIVGVKITCTAGGWGYFDNLTLTAVDSDDNTDVTVTLSDPGFEVDLWNGSPWGVSFPDGESWGTKQVQWLQYADDSYMTVPEGGEDSYVKVYMADGGSLYITQTLTNVPAGTYKVTATSMGGNGETVAVVLGSQVGETVQTDAGYNNWTTSSGEFTVEASDTLTIGVLVTCSAGGWCSIDNLTLTAVDSAGGDAGTEMTELALPNGDFELGTSENWSLTGYSDVASNQWAKNNTTYTLDLWLSDDVAADGAAAYSVTLTPGTYYFTFDLSGHTIDSGLAYSVTAGDAVLAQGGSTYTTGGWDVWQTESTAQFTLTEETEVTFTLSGNQTAGYWGNLDNLKLYGTGSIVVTEVTPAPVDADIYVPYIKGTSGDDFMRGMDISSLLSELNSGVTYYDFDGNELDGQGFMNLLAACGTNWVRIRVWNDPFDASGNGYGGGNCDLDAAITMGKWATNAGMQVFIDFHYSDFWADPGKQQVPKAWSGYTVDQLADAIYDYTFDSLTALKNAGVNVGMVQIGNETTNSLCNVSNWSDRCKLFSAGSTAVRDIDEDILVAIHFTNPERSGNYANFAKQLDTYGVDYDVFASSWYPYWHGTLDNLTSVLKTVADTYGKQVIVAETSWAYTLEDGDGHTNTVRSNSNNTGNYDYSAQGQATEISDVVKAVKNVGDAGIGVFYWEAAWIPVQVYDSTAENAAEVLAQNKALWEQYGSGWASSYAVEYDPSDAGVWYGGSAVDNQALFAFDGTPLASLKTYAYIQTGTTGFDIYVTSIEEVSQTYTIGDTLTLPETLTVSYSFGSDQELPVTWNEADVAAVDMNTPGTYVIHGTVEGGYDAVCTVTVKAENLLLNPSFEESDMSMYDSSAAYAKRTTDDPYTGSYSLHFYNSGIVDFTTGQTVTLEPGHYVFSLYGQGGDNGDDAKIYTYVKIGDTTLTQDFALTGWAVWVNPTIEFDVAETTDVTVGVSVTASQNGGWGTFDDWYLCVNTDPTHSGGEATCLEKAVCDVCGESYGELGDHTGGTATCRHLAQCEVCSEEYGELDPDNHVGGTEVRDAVDATQEHEGYTGDTYCLGCGAKIAEGEVIPKQEPETEPTDPSEEPTDPSEEPTDPSEDPTDPSEEPTDPSEEPTDPSEEPTDPSEEPTDPSEEPIDPSEEPTDPSEEPTDPSEEPTDPSEEPTDPSEEPTDPSEEPTEEPTAPSEEPTDPSEEPTDPSEEPTDPSEEPTDPSEEPTDPSEEPTAPSEEPTDPSKEPTDPSEEPTDPSEEPTEEPTEDPTEEPTAESTKAPSTGSNSNTGDGSGILLWTLMLCFSGLGLFAVLLRKKAA